MQTFIFFAFREAGKLFIWNVDGMPQEFTFLLRLHQTGQNFIHSFFTGQGFKLPLYNFYTWPLEPAIGIELIPFLSLFWSADKVDSALNVLVIVRYYLIGVSFSLLGFYLRQRPLSIMIGAISYTFSGFALYAGVLHPSFMMPMVAFPILLIGAEKILRGENSLVFTITVFFILIFNVYFGCMMAIVTTIYLITRYFCVYKKDGFRGFVKFIRRTLLWGGLGVLLSSVVWLPMLEQMLGTGRSGRSISLSWHYGIDFYKKAFTNFIVNVFDIGYWTCLGLSALAIPAIILLFMDKGKDKLSLKIMLIIFTFMLFCPITTYVMSGFNTLSNRWCFAYALFISLIIMLELPRLAGINKTKLAIIGLGILSYIAICYLIIGSKYYNMTILVLLIIIMAAAGMCYLAGTVGKKSLLLLCLVITCLSCYCTADLLYSPEHRNFVKNFISEDAPYSILESGQYASLAKNKTIQKDNQSWFLVAGNNIIPNEVNASFYYDLNGTSFYTSYGYPKYYNQFRHELEIMHGGYMHQSRGHDARAPILSLLGVKYYADRSHGIWPYGFQKIDEITKNGITDNILVNQYALPLGYTYSSFVTEEDYAGLNALDKQEAMLTSVFLQEAPSSVSIERGSVRQTSIKIPVEKICGKGVSWENGVLTVNEEKAQITLKFNAPPYLETYLRVVNLDLTDGDSERRWDLHVSSGKAKTWAKFVADAWLYSHMEKTQLLYLGNKETGFQECTLTFPAKGEFILDDLEIWCQPIDNYSEQIKSLGAETLDNLQMEWNGLKGHITNTKDKLLFFSLPYSNGWSAYMDGEKTDVLRANIGFMAIELPAGEHEVEMRYCSTGLYVGAVMSFIGLVFLLSLIVYNKKVLGKKHGNI